MKILFEATPDGNALYSLDGTIRAICEVPEGASEDYGYLTMKTAILAAYTGDPATLEFWYDGQEQYLAPDAAADCKVTVEIDT